MAKTVNVHRASGKILTGFVGHIGQYVPGRVTYGQLPLPVQLRDPETHLTYECVLKEIIPFQESIPTVLYIMAELESEINEKKLIDKHGVKSINQLAFYLYEKQK